MTFKLFTLCTISGATSMWLLAGLWHKLIMVQFYTAEKSADHEGTLVIFIAYLILAGLMTTLYSRWEKGGSPAKQGLLFGVLMGLLWVFPHELAMSGAHGEPLAYVFKNAAWHIVEQGFGGWIIASVYAKFSHQEA